MVVETFKSYLRCIFVSIGAGSFYFQQNILNSINYLNKSLILFNKFCPYKYILNKHFGFHIQMKVIQMKVIQV